MPPGAPIGSLIVLGHLGCRRCPIAQSQPTPASDHNTLSRTPDRPAPFSRRASSCPPLAALYAPSTAAAAMAPKRRQSGGGAAAAAAAAAAAEGGGNFGPAYRHCFLQAMMARQYVKESDAKELYRQITSAADGGCCGQMCCGHAAWCRCRPAERCCIAAPSAAFPYRLCLAPPTLLRCQLLPLCGGREPAAAVCTAGAAESQVLGVWVGERTGQLAFGWLAAVELGTCPGCGCSCNLPCQDEQQSAQHAACMAGLWAPQCQLHRLPCTVQGDGEYYLGFVNREADEPSKR